MPPKKKGGKGGSGAIIDGVDTSQMTREQLEVFAHRIKEENEREREERNFFQLERDKLRTFWEITRTELEEARAKLRNKDRQIEEEAEKNDEELKFYKQKVKHLQYEHQHDLTEARAEGLVALKLAEDEHIGQERELLRDKRELKLKNIDAEVSYLDQLKSIKMNFSEQLSEARKEYETNIKELNIKYEKAFIKLKTDMGVKHRMEVSEVEERKNQHISDLTRNHEKAFTEMKNYYNDITLNNLALISSLKDQMEILRKQNERMSKQVADLTAENKRLVEPLKKALADVTEYQRLLRNYEKDKLSLVNTKAKLSQTKKELSDLKWANEALELRFEKLQAERDKLHESFIAAVLEVQQKTGLKNVLLKNKIDSLYENVEIQEATIGELELASDEQPDKINKKLKNILANKNAIIQDLKYEVAKATKAHDDLLDAYEEKLIAFGIPKEELGYLPLRYIPRDQEGPGRGPAGLVTENK